VVTLRARLRTATARPNTHIISWRAVSGVFGLDVLLVYLAFRANYRSARAYEEVTVTASELTVRKVNHHGGVRQWTLNPLWVQLDRIVHAEFGIERLFLISHGRRLAIAGFLSPAEKASFARALTSALGEARRGPLGRQSAPDSTRFIRPERNRHSRRTNDDLSTRFRSRVDTPSKFHIKFARVKAATNPSTQQSTLRRQ
jgi:uncharacterized membrane protein